MDHEPYVYLIYCDSLYYSGDDAMEKTKHVLNALYKRAFNKEPNFKFIVIIPKVQKQRTAEDKELIGTDCGLHCVLFALALTIYLEDYEWTEESPCYHRDNIDKRLVKDLLLLISYKDTISLRSYTLDKINE